MYTLCYCSFRSNQGWRHEGFCIV